MNMQEILNLQKSTELELWSYLNEYKKLKEWNISDFESPYSLVRELEQTQTKIEHLSLVSRYSDYNFLNGISREKKDIYILLFTIFLYLEYYNFFLKKLWDWYFNMKIELTYSVNDEMLFPKIFYYLDSRWCDDNYNIVKGESSVNIPIYVLKLLKFWVIDRFSYSCNSYEESWEVFYDVSLFLN